MRDLEEAIADWRKRMAAGGVKAPAVLDELEGHLREEVRVQMAGGAVKEEAFKMAVVRMGSAKSVRSEFEKINGSTCLPVTIGVSAWAVLVLCVVVLVLRQMAKGRVDMLLGAHIFTLTSGFLGAFVVGSLGVCYLGWEFFGELPLERGASLRKAAWAFVQISLAFTVVGYVLGILWTSKHRGFYWSGSFKEIGSLCMALWLVGLALIQRFRPIGGHALMLLCASSNVVAAVGWFAAGILSVDPRLARFGNYWPLEIFLIVHLLFIAMSLGRGLSPAES